MLRESEAFVYYFDVRVLLFCRSCVVGHECFFKCWGIELVSERCIVSLLDRVVEVKPTYILLLLSEIQSPKGHLNLYITLVLCNGQYLNQFPPEYDKSNTGIRTDPEENM